MYFDDKIHARLTDEQMKEIQFCVRWCRIEDMDEPMYGTQSDFIRVWVNKGIKFHKEQRR